jgi:hypothetical protein
MIDTYDKLMAAVAGAGPVDLDPLADAVVRGLRGDTDIPSSISHACEILQSEYRRSTIEALFVAGASTATIERATGIPADVSRLVASVLLPGRAFRDEVALREWAEDQLAAGPPGVRTGWLQCAVSHGLEYLLSELGGGTYDPELDAMADRVTVSAYKRTMRSLAAADVARAHSVFSDRADEAARRDTAMFLDAAQVAAKLRKEGRRARQAAQEDTSGPKLVLIQPVAWEAKPPHTSPPAEDLDSIEFCT